MTAIAGIACLALLLPIGASAATVVNGDFETGTLSGWSQNITDPFAEGEGWFAYSGTAAPLFEEPREVPPPPQGKFAAISDEGGPGLHVLYQDIALEPATSQTLSMLVYYRSHAAIAVPSPDTLSPGEEKGPESANQQYRIDVMKPSAPLDSVNPADILTTVFRTNPGDPEELTPKLVTANLTPFVGQTVRLRLAEVDNQFFFNAGADSVSISTVPLPPSNLFTYGKLKLNKKKGTGQLQVKVPGPGTETAVEASSNGSTKVKGRAYVSKKKAAAKLIKPVTVTAVAAGTVALKIKPTAAGRKILKEKHKLRFRALVTFTPVGGIAASQTFSGKLKLKPTPKRSH